MPAHAPLLKILRQCHGNSNKLCLQYHQGALKQVLAASGLCHGYADLGQAMIVTYFLGKKGHQFMMKAKVCEVSHL